MDYYDNIFICQKMEVESRYYGRKIRRFNFGVFDSFVGKMLFELIV